MVEEKTKSENPNYLTDNFWKRTLGYFLVAILAVLLGCSITKYWDNICIQQIVYCMKISWKLFGYLIITALLFIASYVSLYTNRCAKNGYKVIVGVECLLFIGMISFGLDFKKNASLSVLLILYGVITLSAMLFYYRLVGEQLEYVRYELLWPAIYTIALSAYMGYTLVYCSGKQIGFSHLFPVLLLLLYEYVLFLSNIPNQNQENDKVRIGFVHFFFVLVFIGAIGLSDSCIRMIYFLLFSAVSAILEALDVIARKTDHFLKEQYEAAMCCAICVILFLSSIILFFAETILIEQVFFLIALIEIYSIIFYNISEKNEYRVKIIDVTKMTAFIVSIVIIFVLFYTEKMVMDVFKDIHEKVQNIIKPTGTVLFIGSICISILSIICKFREFWDWLKFIKDQKVIWKFLTVSRLFIYLSFTCFVVFLLFAAPFWAQSVIYRTNTIAALMFFLVILNLLSYWIVKKK